MCWQATKSYGDPSCDGVGLDELHLKLRLAGLAEGMHTDLKW